MAEHVDTDAMPSPQASLRRPWSVWIVLLLVLIAALVLLLVDPSWTTPRFRALGPYVIVALLGGIVGLAEVASTFSFYPREALRTRWAQLLILVNAAAATLAFWLVHIVAPDTNPALLVIGVGIGFQAVIQTQFTLAKQLGESGGDISFNIGWLYDQFQNLCKTQIDLELMQGRRTAVTRLLQRYPTLRELHGIATYTIMSRATLTSEEQAGPDHMKVDTFGKPYLHTLHIAFKANRISAEVPRSSKGSCFGSMAIRLL